MLPWFTQVIESDANLGNDLLLRETESRENLIPCLCALPDEASNPLDASKLVNSLIRRGARAVVLYPATHGYAMKDWCVGPLVSAIEERRLPLLLGWTEFDLDVSAEETRLIVTEGVVSLTPVNEGHLASPSSVRVTSKESYVVALNGIPKPVAAVVASPAPKTAISDISK